MSAHISSFVVLCRPAAVAAVRAAVAAVNGVSIHHCGADGRIVALAEGGDEAQVGAALLALQSLPGVLAANLVYHGIDDEARP